MDGIKVFGPKGALIWKGVPGGGYETLRPGPDADVENATVVIDEGTNRCIPRVEAQFETSLAVRKKKDEAPLVFLDGKHGSSEWLPLKSLDRGRYRMPDFSRAPARNPQMTDTDALDEALDVATREELATPFAHRFLPSAIILRVSAPTADGWKELKRLKVLLR